MNPLLPFFSLLFFSGVLCSVALFYLFCWPVRHYDAEVDDLSRRVREFFKEMEEKERPQKVEKNQYALNATLGLLGRKNFDIEFSSFPHLFIGGATNGGKTTLIYNLLNSMLLQNSDLKVIIYSPKRSDFHAYAEIKTREIKIFNEPKEMEGVLQSVVEEIDRRDQLFQEAKKFNRLIKGEIQSYNRRRSIGVSALPYCFVLIDELSDLLGTKSMRRALGDIARKGRYVGVHLCLATTQLHKIELGPSIAANLPARIAVRTADERASEKILGHGKKDAATLDPSKGEAIFVLGWQNKNFKSKLITESDIFNVVKKLNGSA